MKKKSGMRDGKGGEVGRTFKAAGKKSLIEIPLYEHTWPTSKSSIPCETFISI